jgi:hypothetical protein
MKAHELLSSPERWCKESPAEDLQGNRIQAFDPRAVKWCALGAIQKTYPYSQWGEVMDSLLRALSVSERGLAQMNEPKNGNGIHTVGAADGFHRRKMLRAGISQPERSESASGGSIPSHLPPSQWRKI